MLITVCSEFSNLIGIFLWQFLDHLEIKLVAFEKNSSTGSMVKPISFKITRTYIIQPWCPTKSNHGNTMVFHPTAIVGSPEKVEGKVGHACVGSHARLGEGDSRQQRLEAWRIGTVLEWRQNGAPWNLQMWKNQWYPVPSMIHKWWMFHV